MLIASLVLGWLFSFASLALLLVKERLEGSWLVAAKNTWMMGISDRAWDNNIAVNLGVYLLVAIVFMINTIFLYKVIKKSNRTRYLTVVLSLSIFLAVLYLHSVNLNFAYQINCADEPRLLGIIKPCVNGWKDQLISLGIIKEKGDDNEDLPEHIPLKPPETKDQIGWHTFNFTDDDKSVAFSFKYPDLGDYCNGCIDGWPFNGAPANVHGQWITGGYYQNTPEGWSLTVGVYLPNVKPAEGETFDDNIPNMVNKLNSLPIGGSTEFPDRYGSDIAKAKRIKDSVAFDKNVKTFEVEENGGKSKYALIDFPNYTIIVTYAWSRQPYDVFEDILGSFSEKLADNPDFGEKLDHYNVRKNGVSPWK